ncbi:MAG TPA: DUF1592 domain-containing protein [Kofleriaceae bacterium]|nr:DUF1592 domain-containing protein [Kofleriaceae bacterium]
MKGIRAASLSLVVAAACSSNSAGYDYAHSKGAALYQASCQVCHGETGEGGLGPALVNDSKSVAQLESIISASMPANAPGQCTGDCATQTAQFIHDGLTTSALRCDRAPPTAPRRLRLLTRREYRATVHALFGDAAPAMTCARELDCVYRDTCIAGNCEATACNAETFVYDPHGQTLQTVHVAGDFNNWAATIAAGGLPLALDPATGLWTGTFTIGEGTHSYKLVLDEATWIADPRAPSSMPDGYGGQNSVLALSCTDPGPTPDDPTVDFPVETRAADFPFDTDADAALVTSPYVDAYLAAAEQLATFAAADPNTLSPCDWAGSRASCATSLVTTLGRQVFRRKLTSDEVTRYTALVTGATDATTGVQTALEAMLMSPSFLYRSELGTSDGNGRYKLAPYEIATALAYTFWGTTPDEELLEAAESGALKSPAGIEAEARRLIADPRARTQLGEFVLQWIGGQGVETTEKRADLFPGFDAARDSLEAETRDFADDVVFDGDGTYESLLTANYTVLDPIAAEFYGLPPPAGGKGRVPYGDGTRAGLLGHASLLSTTAHSDQTSPVERGLLIRRNFLCEDLPPPPPNGGGLPPVDPNATTRERFEMHAATPACAGCHTYIDDPGFGLEAFDAVGRWRTTENGLPIDASGDMNDVERIGTNTSAPFTTQPQLAQIIATSQAAPACFTRQWLRFSRGLRETLAERCGRLWIQARWDAAGHDVRELMVQSVLSPDFVERR